MSDISAEKQNGKGLTLNANTMVSILQLLVVLFGGAAALGSFQNEMAEIKDAVKPLMANVQQIETRTELMQMEQTELGKRVDRIELKIDNAATLHDQDKKP